MRRAVTIFALAVMAVAMMGAEDPGCDKAKGRQPQSAEHDPKALNPKYSTKPSDRTYLFRIQFSTLPTTKVDYSYFFGSTGEHNLEWDGAAWSTQRRVSPGTVISLTVDSPRKTILTCAIVYVPDKTPKLTRLRAHHIENEPPRCAVHYRVRVGEENIPSL